MSESTPGLTSFLSDPCLRERYEKVRRFFYLKESAYDISSMCQLAVQRLLLLPRR